MAPWVTALAALAEDSAQFPAPTQQLTTICNCNLNFLTLRTLHAYNTHILQAKQAYTYIF